jgi:hypothetical protein
MGQGRHIGRAFRSILLIVSAIEGVTPDARDIASPLAIRLVGSAILGQAPDLDEDDASHAGCEAVAASQDWQAPHHLERGTGNGSPHRADRSAREGCRGLGAGSLIIGTPRGVDLSLTLCRLVC